ncbi:hypothetical protein CCO03_07320 [Comamonas serinivorans]|uniref:FAD-binding domain-containing protein n=1 Tax=Comamonas serinivorans TaxID=1082851 RepID=A0A1Y0EM40_9BURK|nr:FAD-dependent monooxygenase [Comamonas serinivorans]ARU04511.1 hypothetical protein CCO03_07320 [Comamonas serinivorans]
MTATAHADVLIVGAGPAGLSLAISLTRAGLRTTVLEQQPEAQLARPAPDGREIALTLPSVATLTRLGTWQHLQAHECGHIRQAVVHDGPVGWRPTLDIDAAGSAGPGATGSGATSRGSAGRGSAASGAAGKGSADPGAGDTGAADHGLDALGRIVPNHALRRTAWQVASELAADPGTGLRLITGARVSQVQVHDTHAALQFTCNTGYAGPQDRFRPDANVNRGASASAPSPTSGPTTDTQHLRAPLLVAADSRMSAMRRLLGVGAQMRDFGRTVIVCRMRHALPHNEVAHECFGWERTLAILPLPAGAETTTEAEAQASAHHCSAVVTTDNADAARLMALDEQAFAAEVQGHFRQRLGPMALVGQRHTYPLLATYAHRLAGPRFALLGDAAVGMHPVTAHGFNLGLAGVERLTAAIVAARRAGRDWGTAQALAPYARGQHRHAWPIYQGTNAVVGLFTDARPLPRLLRQAVLQGARRLPPLRAAIASQLTGRSPWRLLVAQLPRPMR